MFLSRRTLLAGIPAVVGARLLSSCSTDSTVTNSSEEPVAGEPGSLDSTSVDTTQSTEGVSTSTGWRMPAEDDPHERTWMCWPSSEEVWGDGLADVQDNITKIALAIAEFEPVAMLARPEQIEALAEIFGGAVELITAPVDDLWARDSLANFVVRTGDSGAIELASAHATFNGWGDKQIHEGDTQLAAVVAEHLGVELFDSGLVGEGGGIEIDGVGTVLAAEGCWVNNNRNPAMSRDEIEVAILQMVGAERMIWVDGLAGADITDGHIDTLARFANPSTIVVDKPAFDDPDNPWIAVANRTKEQVTAAQTADGSPYTVIEIVQPSESRGSGDDFLSTYMNYYVCNGAVIAPEFGDPAGDAAARIVLEDLFPDRKIVMLNIDGLAAGGGGIHCATQQQPRIA
jgi:agmatine deiminase